MPKYIVGKKAIIDGSTVYKSGDTVELTEKQAEQLGLAPVKEKTPPPPPGGQDDKDKKPEPPKKLSADEAIAAIGECKTIEDVKAFFKGEERSTVIDAARAKIKALKDAEKK